MSGFGGSNFGSAPSGGFGSPAGNKPGSGFGPPSSNSGGGFGSAQGAVGFGAPSYKSFGLQSENGSTNADSSSGGFGGAGGGFGGAGDGFSGFGGGNYSQAISFGQGLSASPAPSSNPFGGSASSGANLVTFGSPANFVNNKDSFRSTPLLPTGGWGQPVSEAKTGSASKPHFGNGMSTSSGNNFQSKTTGAALNPFGGSSSNDSAASFSTMPQTTQGTNPFGGTESNSGRSPMFASQAKSNNKEWKRPVISQSVSFLPSNPSDIAADVEKSTERSMAEQEKQLKAKIKERKRIEAELEEKKQKLRERTQKKKKQPKDNSALNAAAVPFLPKSTGHKGDKTPGDAPDKSAKSFREYQPDAVNSKTRSLLPQGIKATGVDLHKEAGREGREDFETAVSLVGTCQYMCPDDELIRREQENDIQLLEIPQPGTLHPADWTLRNTVVKRFRRSAADYKLDVPEWIRPPDVLEEVCGYLEEWVMERDRQGPDPRFPNNQAPQSLDIYQFIWNRTRMVRKDFTLQNYVGTGGNCDARAVRCHERIARWHAMCEHQLSHISDFTRMQSQQNIQELGQTMKTLNQFYDDSMNRSLIEVPDENGKETRLDLTKFSHGCSSDKVCGNGPIDFDGSALNNTPSGSRVTKRLLGKHAVGKPCHGTAEPEMRGLYILLTINNDGGMEVLKYAARLFKERPTVYHSSPVQLALAIYKAKKEFNYVRFFRILRSSSTPYLFCCVMFKYVELMRKDSLHLGNSGTVAIRIMSKTYGARKKDTGETIYDSYPLQHLQDLLCYEDLDEAREACKHYNITVKPINVSSSSDPSGSKIVEFIFWRKGDFKEPVHPEKGYNLPLQPRKMMRTIESKLNGTTRLGVCRGEVSGEGAVLPGTIAEEKTAESNPMASSPLASSLMSPSISTLRQNAELQRPEKEDTIEADGIAKEAEKCKQARLLEEKQERAEEMQRLAEIKQKEQERKEDAVRRAQFLEAKSRKESEARRKKKEDAERQARLIRAQEQRRQLEEEEARRQWEQKKLRMLETQRREREYHMKLAKEERRRQIEAARLQQIALAAEAKRRQEAEERRRAKEWEERVDFARKTVLFNLWCRHLSRELEMTQRSKKMLKQIDPTFSQDMLQVGVSLQRATRQRVGMTREKGQLRLPNPRSIMEDLLHLDSGRKLSLSAMALGAIKSLSNFRYQEEDTVGQKRTFLQKIGVVVGSDGKSSFSELVRLWVSSRLDSEKVVAISHTSSCEVRSVVALYNDASECSDCDVVLEVVSPGLSKNAHMPTGVVLTLDEKPAESFPELGTSTSPFHIYLDQVSPHGYEVALKSACKKVVELFVHETSIRINRLSMFQLAATAIIKAVWVPMPFGANEEEAIVARCTSALFALAAEVEAQLSANEQVWAQWPPREFTSPTGKIDSYFSATEGLPANWMDSLGGRKFEDEISLLLPVFNGNFREIIRGLLGATAPRSLREECTSMVSKRQFRGCLERVLLWRQGHVEHDSRRYVYIPDGLLDSILEGVVHRLEIQDSLSKSAHVSPFNFIPESCPFLAASDSVPNRSDGTRVQRQNPGAESTDVVIALPATQECKESNLETSNKRKNLIDESLNSSQQGFNTEQKRRCLRSTPDIVDSAAFSSRLESLLSGDSVDFQVGDKSIRSILLDKESSLIAKPSLLENA